jgi:hypothetical protein
MLEWRSHDRGYVNSVGVTDDGFSMLRNLAAT